MKTNILTGFFILFSFLVSSDVGARCHIRANSSDIRNGDLLFRLLSQTEGCPKDVFEFRSMLTRDGLIFKTTMVANRGFHNPTKGSFSLFEIVTGNSRATTQKLNDGEFFFGHFMAPQDDQTLIADQDPSAGNLMIELILWDPTKGVFNFYELIGDGQQGQWFFRGDSGDIAKDVRFLHRTVPAGRSQFGKTLRCTGCHLAGGPIMKELAPPHNDWWTQLRPLQLGGRKPDHQLSEILKTLVSASDLSESVKAGVHKLQEDHQYQNYQSSLSLQERLRPLFCPMELNLESDHLPLDDQRDFVNVPSGFFIDPRLARGEQKMALSDYLKSLKTLKFRFPETERRDADHAWLVPVKAYSDQVSVQALIHSGVIDEKFALAVLSVDMTNPVFSDKRCGLLKLLPNDPAVDWKKRFLESLRNANQDLFPGAEELLSYLTDNAHSLRFFQERADLFLRKTGSELLDPSKANHYVALLNQRRQAILRSAISKNPRGQILEPGFRIIFPEVRLGPGALNSELPSIFTMPSFYE